MVNSRDKEIWKPVAGYKGLYEVSNLGRVRGVERIVAHPICKKVCRKSIVLKPYISKHNGYVYVQLSKNGKATTMRVHKIVSLAFMPKISGKDQINHINGDKTDNRVVNLERVTQSENMKHAYRIGLEKVTWNRKVIRLNDGKVFNSMTEAAKSVGGNKASSIRRACTGERNHYKGFRWAFCEEGKNYVDQL